MLKSISDLTPLLGRVSTLFMAQQSKCPKTTPFCPPKSGSSLRSSVTTATTTTSEGTQVEWKPPETARMKQGRDPKNNGGTGKRRAQGLTKKGKKHY